MKLSKSFLSSSVLTLSVLSLASGSFAFDRSQGEKVMTFKTPLTEQLLADQIVLKNDSFNDNNGSAFIQQGFVTGEQVGIWVEVPANVKNFKIDSFRVLMGNINASVAEPTDKSATVFFSMGIAPSGDFRPQMPRDIENAADVTPGPYWNDIPAIGEGTKLGCAKGGELIGAALEFTHSGLPSVYRDIDGLSNVKKNTLMATPGGWNYSVVYGLRGDWVLRVVGHEALEGECAN